MSTSVPARGSEAPSASFEEIEEAVMESERGRWFLDEFARRQRSQETTALFTAIARLESAVKSSQELIAERVQKAVGLITTVDAKLAQTPGAPPPAHAVAEAEPRRASFFAQDEELFEPARPPEAGIGATLVMHRRGEPEQPMAEAPPQPLPEADPFSGMQPKNRIVIIRHKASDEIAVPMQDAFRETA